MTPDTAIRRVMILEDTERIRDALITLFESSPGFVCVGACATAESALRQIPSHQPEVILVDLELPGMSGTEFLRTCRRRFPEIELIVLTMHDTAQWIFPALEAGASGYVVKGTPPAKLIEAITEVCGGGSFMSSQVARLVLQSFRHRSPPASAETALSPREQEVLTQLTRGLRTAEIAGHLGISQRTVSTHLHRIYHKLHVHSAAGAVGKLLGKDGARGRVA
jgi:DNA-binding NarL/FixJ family response regulator